MKLRVWRALQYCQCGATAFRLGPLGHNKILVQVVLRDFIFFSGNKFEIRYVKTGWWVMMHDAWCVKDVVVRGFWGRVTSFKLNVTSRVFYPSSSCAMYPPSIRRFALPWTAVLLMNNDKSVLRNWDRFGWWLRQAKIISSCLTAFFVEYIYHMASSQGMFFKPF